MYKRDREKEIKTVLNRLEQLVLKAEKTKKEAEKGAGPFWPCFGVCGFGVWDHLFHAVSLCVQISAGCGL